MSSVSTPTHHLMPKSGAKLDGYDEVTAKRVTAVEENSPHLSFKRPAKMGANMGLWNNNFFLQLRPQSGDYVQSAYELMGEYNGNVLEHRFSVADNIQLRLLKSAAYFGGDIYMGGRRLDDRYQAKTQIYKSAELTLTKFAVSVWAHGAGRTPDPGDYGAYLVWRGGTKWGMADGDQFDLPGHVLGGATSTSGFICNSTHMKHIRDGTLMMRSPQQITFNCYDENVKLVFWVRR